MSPVMQCYYVEQQSDGTLAGSLQSRPACEPAAGEVRVRVRYSSVNYKDALAATGQAGIVKSFPHVPGIDAAGIVEKSNNPRFPPGMEVFTTGHELGVERWGGWGEFICVPGDWLQPAMDSLTIREAMIYGTAGFTAAQCVQGLLERSVDSGEILVTGATGGVGALAIMILKRLKFHVVAVTGKAEQHDWVKALGADEIVGRDFLSPTSRPLLASRFAGAVDTVGGTPLAEILKRLKQRGCVACCGLTAGVELNTSVYPFILRGITLAGIDSVWCPDGERPQLWQHLATDWKPEHLEQVVNPVSLSQAGDVVSSMLRGEHVGRSVIEI